MAEGDAAADEALAAADALGLDSAWSDTAVSQVRARPATPTRSWCGAGSTRRWCARAGPATSTWRCGCCSTWPPSRSRRGRIEETLTWTPAGRPGRARDLGIEWSFYPRGAAAPAGHRPVHGRRLGRQPGRGRPAGPGAGDGRARARRRAAGAGRPRAIRRRRERLAWAQGADPAAARARAARAGDRRVGDRPGGLGRRPARPPWTVALVASPPAAGAVAGRPPRRAAAGGRRRWRRWPTPPRRPGVVGDARRPSTGG